MCDWFLCYFVHLICVHFGELSTVQRAHIPFIIDGAGQWWSFLDKYIIRSSVGNLAQVMLWFLRIEGDRVGTAALCGRL